MLFKGKKRISSLFFIDNRPICSYLAAHVFAEELGVTFGMDPDAADPDEMMDFCIEHPRNLAGGDVMAVFKRITSKVGETVWINTDQVRMIVPAKADGVELVGSSVVVFDNGAMEVRGTPYNVVQELEVSV